MNETCENSCSKHGGKYNPARIPMDDLMHGLPQNQGGKGRHKCPYCAYELGFSAGMRYAVASVRARLDSMVDENI